MPNANGGRRAIGTMGLLGIGLLALLAKGCIVADGDSSVTVYNDSDYVIVEINITPSYSDTWGPDYLGPDVLYPGDSLTIDDIDCGSYDMRIVDDTGVECVFYDYDLCWDDDIWTITNAMLDECAFG
jgi:hypothetical protein